MSNVTIGVDISKDTLDAHRLPDGASRSFANTPAGHKALIAWAGHGVTRIVFEPTGPYHAAFERALAGAGLPLVKVNPRQARRFAILLSIPGIARVSAFTLLIEMPELGAMDAKQAASLACLAPVACQSGRWTGSAFIRGGRASLRQALCMPALVAMRFNPDLQAKYRQLVDAGKPAKVAITAIMRKLVVLANALSRHGRKWSEHPA